MVELQEGVGASWGECPHLMVGTQMGAERRPPSPLFLGNPSAPAFSLPSGKFGAVCTCTEKATGLKLAAKVIKKQTPKDKVVGVGACYVKGRESWSRRTSHLPLPTCLSRWTDGQPCHWGLIPLSVNQTPP